MDGELADSAGVELLGGIDVFGIEEFGADGVLFMLQRGECKQVLLRRDVLEQPSSCAYTNSRRTKRKIQPGATKDHADHGASAFVKPGHPGGACGLPTSIRVLLAWPGDRRTSSIEHKNTNEATPMKRTYQVPLLAAALVSFACVAHAQQPPDPVPSDNILDTAVGQDFRAVRQHKRGRNGFGPFDLPANRRKSQRRASGGNRATRRGRVHRAAPARVGDGCKGDRRFPIQWGRRGVRWQSCL